MNWYFDSNGQQTGPVEAGDILHRLQTGEIHPGTLVRRDGLPAWVTLGQVLPELQGGPLTAHPLELCGECGFSFPPADLLSYGAHRLCRTCKPGFIERLQAGLSPSGGHIPSLLVWRQDKLVIMARDGELPGRCWKCNSTDGLLKLNRSASWLPPWVYRMNSLVPLGALICAAFVRKKVSLKIPLCAIHAAARKRDFGIAWGSFLLGVLAFTSAVMLRHDGMEDVLALLLCGGLVFGCALVLFSFLYGHVRCGIFDVTLITDTHLHLSGSGPAFRASLQEWNGY